MGEQATTQLANTAGVLPPVGATLLQRRCPCGTHTVGGSECDSCARGNGRGQTLQRETTNAGAIDDAPSVVHEVLNSPGQPLDVATRSFFEPRFHHDFSRVRVHTDALAAESARAVGAQAYTVGTDLAFAVGQFAPETSAGRRLLAHELAHTMQQNSAFGLQGKFEISLPNDSSEAEADTIAESIIDGKGRVQPATQTRPHVARQTSAKVGASTPKENAVKQHVAQQQRVATLIQDGLKPIPGAVGTRDKAKLFQNSCQWIQEGKSSLVIFSRTHDATTRRAGSMAYFDRMVKYPATGGDYAEVPATGDDDHILYAPTDWAGGMQANEFSLLDPARHPDEELKSTFIHEVQHDANQTFWGRATQPPPGRVEGTPGLTGGDALVSAGLYNGYQSEFRAYWIEKPQGSPQDKFGSATNPATNTKPVTWTNPQSRTFSRSTSFKNERQENIFWFIASKYPALQVAHTYTQDASYRSMVDTFDQPVGINLVNSVRVQELSDALKSCNRTMDGSAPAIQTLLRKAGALDAADRASLIDQTSSAPFWAQARAALSQQMLEELRLKIDPSSAVPKPVPARPKFPPLYRPRRDFRDKMVESVEGL